MDSTSFHRLNDRKFSSRCPPHTATVWTIFAGLWPDACLDGNRFIVPGFPVEHVVRTIGAGDVFTAGFVAAMSHHHTWHQCLRLALKAASDHVQGKTPVPLKDILPEVTAASIVPSIQAAERQQHSASRTAFPFRRGTSILSATAALIITGLWLSLR